MIGRVCFGLMAILTVVFIDVSHADGPPMKNGRFSGGPVTVLELTEGQIASLSKDRTLALTKEQIVLVKNEFGLSPSHLEVWNTKDGEVDCTCFAWNLAFRFEELRVEVPHRYLVSDKEAIRRQAEVDAIN